MAADCTSHTAVKGVAADSAHGSFSGLVYVAPDAQRTDSVQSSRNVTIGNARIETLPQLEIYADDVKCSHGATVGQMDSDAILYMRQRGLTTAMAKRLQIEGFVQDVAMHSAVENLKEELMELITTKLNSL
jgi:Fe-S cluster assembly protein SufD